MEKLVNGTTPLIERARAMRVETAALLTAARIVFGRAPSSITHPNLSEDWMPRYHRQVQEKLSILQLNRTIRNSC